MAVTYDASGSLTINGITSSGPGMTLLAKPAYAIAAVAADDYLAETYTVNAGTTGTTVNMGKIDEGAFIWIQSNQPINVTMTQGVPTAVTFTTAGSLVGYVGHPFSDDDVVKFKVINVTTGISVETEYYVVNANVDDFQVSLTQGGVAVTLTGDGDGSMYVPTEHRFEVKAFMSSDAKFTELKLGNDGATAAQVVVVLVGSRPENPDTPGIF